MPIIKDIKGGAVVEAAILFPIMIMIFAALVLLAMYLPTRAALQRAAQYAATAVATEISDSWLYYDDGSMSYKTETDRNLLANVYAELLGGGDSSSGELIAEAAADDGIAAAAGRFSAECQILNRIIYKEAVVTASREFDMPVNLSFIGFPETLKITVTSTAAVVNGDEFIRNIDLTVEFLGYISRKFGLTDLAESISSGYGSVASFFGWR